MVGVDQGLGWLEYPGRDRFFYPDRSVIGNNELLRRLSGRLQRHHAYDSQMVVWLKSQFAWPHPALGFATLRIDIQRCRFADAVLIIEIFGHSTKLHSQSLEKLSRLRVVKGFAFTSKIFSARSSSGSFVERIPDAGLAIGSTAVSPSLALGGAIISIASACPPVATAVPTANTPHKVRKNRIKR